MSLNYYLHIKKKERKYSLLFKDKVSVIYEYEKT